MPGTRPRDASNPQHRIFRVGEVAEARALRALEIFRHAAAAEPAEEARDGTVGVDNDEGPAVPCQDASDRPGEANEVADVAAVNQLRAGYAEPDQAGAEHEGVSTLACRAPQADAAVHGVLKQHLLVEGIEGHFRLPMRIEYLDRGAAEQFLQHRHRNEDAVAIARKTLRFDDRPRVRRRRDIQIGDVLMPKRLRREQRRVGAEGRFDVPAGKVAAGGERVARPHDRADEQDGADHDTVAVQQVTIFRQSLRRLAPGQLRKGMQPEQAIAVREFPRQQRRDGVDIGFFDLTAAESRHGKHHRVDQDHFVNLIVSVARIYRGGVNKLWARNMSVKLTIMKQMEQVAQEHGRILAPLNDELVLANCGLDLLGFAVLVARLEDTLGVDPFTAAEDAFFPATLGEFVKVYEHGGR